MGELDENVRFEDSFDNYISTRIFEELYSLLLQDPEYCKWKNKRSDFQHIIIERLPEKIWETYENINLEVETRENKFYYLQGCQDSVKFRDLQARNDALYISQLKEEYRSLRTQHNYVADQLKKLIRANLELREQLMLLGNTKKIEDAG